MRAREIDMGALEAAIQEAALMADLTREFMFRTLGFDQRNVPPLDRRDAELVNFAVHQTSVMTQAVHDAFYGPEDGR